RLLAAVIEDALREHTREARGRLDGATRRVLGDTECAIDTTCDAVAGLGSERRDTRIRGRRDAAHRAPHRLAQRTVLEVRAEQRSDHRQVARLRQAGDTHLEERADVLCLTGSLRAGPRSLRVELERRLLRALALAHLLLRGRVLLLRLDVLRVGLVE